MLEAGKTCFDDKYKIIKPLAEERGIDAEVTTRITHGKAAWGVDTTWFV